MLLCTVILSGMYGQWKNKFSHASFEFCADWSFLYDISGDSI